MIFPTRPHLLEIAVTLRLASAFTLLAMPALAQQTAQPNAPTLRATYGDWEIRCITDTDCVMTQLHRRSEQSADAVFTVVKPQGLTGDDGQPIEAFAEIVVPLGVYLPGGLGLKVDESPAKAAPYERCIDEGCVVRAPISPTMLANMRAGATAYIVIFGGPERPVQIPISLAGFTAAFDSF
jgi:invasion protein IalB